MTRHRALLAGLLIAVLGAVAVPAALGLAPAARDAAADAGTAGASDTPTSTLPSSLSPSAVAPASAIPPPSVKPTASSSRSPDNADGTLTATGLVPGSVNATSLNLTAEYDASLRVGFTSRSFLVSEAIQVTNTSGKAIDRLELNTIAARLGRMTLTMTRVGGAPVHATVSDQTILLPLGGILASGASTGVEIHYRATLRADTAGSNWLFTRANGILEAHRWLPWISRATPFSRPNHGDPFVTPVSPRVRVTIIGDRTIRWATTGESAGGSGLSRVFEARNVRDFAITGAPDYRLSTATVDGVAIRVWSRPGFPASTVLSAARTALSREAKLLGPYPYPTYELAQTAGGFGMESPGLTWIPTGAGSLPYLVAHETGHQWFYGIVGNDQARQPFADEAATDFVARYALGLRRASRCSTARLDLSIYRYSSACYYEDIYIQGGNFLDDTRKRMGSTAFWAAMRDYLARYRFKIGSTKALLDTLDAHTPLNLVPRYEPRFPGLY